jgi:hypothetical protein
MALLQAESVPTAAALAVASARPATELNALFEKSDGWIGGDGATSVRLGPGRTLWLFADTWVGKVEKGKRFDATIVNNSAAIQEGNGTGAAMRFFIRRAANGKAQALLAAGAGRGWFWPQAAVISKGRLYLFLTEVERSGQPGPFGFRLTGQWLGLVTNPLDTPTQWQIKQFKLPYAEFRADHELSFGATLLEEREYFYVYGVAEQVQKSWRKKQLVLARAPRDSLADFSAWRFYGDGRWQTDPHKASLLMDGVANDYSVSYHRALGSYVLIYTENGLSPRILARTAKAPWGPWSAATVVYQCPEAGWDKRIFCYGAKAHPELAADDELVINYVANSFDFWQVAADARLYWPKFIRVKVRTNRPAGTSEDSACEE